MRASLEVADIFHNIGPAYQTSHTKHLNLIQLKVMTTIETYRTTTLDDHVKTYEDYRHQQIAYNSCRNQHCPKCQNTTART